MIIWSGHGYLVAIFFFIGLVVTQLIMDSVLGDGYYTAHTWPKSLAMMIIGAACWFAGRKMNLEPTIDPETGATTTIPTSKHTLFFIKLEYWSLIYVAFALWTIWK